VGKNRKDNTQIPAAQIECDVPHPCNEKERHSTNWGLSHLRSNEALLLSIPV